MEMMVHVEKGETGAAFPLECPYPHLSGSTNPQTPDEWLESTGEETTATNEEMMVHVEKGETGVVFESNSTQEVEAPIALPWSPEEELLVCRQPPAQLAEGSSLFAKLRHAVLFVVVGLVAYGLVQNSVTVSSCVSGG